MQLKNTIEGIEDSKCIV